MNKQEIRKVVLEISRIGRKLNKMLTPGREQNKPSSAEFRQISDALNKHLWDMDIVFPYKYECTFVGLKHLRDIVRKEVGYENS